MYKLGSIIKNYRIIQEMKKGAQGFVYVVEEVKTHKRCILKSLLCVDESKRKFEKMIKSWEVLCKSAVKDYIVEYIEHFYEGENTLIIMEFCENGDLETLIKKKALQNEKFGESEVIKVLIEAMSALDVMQLLKFIHRDVKAANMLIGADGKYKMSDNITSTGTPEYTAPEIVKTEEYSFPVDVYSLGVILYQMMVGHTPFVNARGVNMLNVATGKYDPIGADLGYSSPLTSLVHKCLSLDPSARPTPADVLVCPLVVRALRERDRAEMAELRREFAALKESDKAEVAELRREVNGLRRELAELKLKEKKTEESAVSKEKIVQQLHALNKRECCKLHFGFLPQPPPADVTYDGNVVKFRASDFRHIVSVDAELVTGGIYVLEVALSGEYIDIGIALKTLFPAIFQTRKYLGNHRGSCLLVSCNGFILLHGSGFSGGGSWDFGKNASVSLQVDTSSHTLHFFANDNQLPHVIIGVPDGVCFAFNNLGGQSQCEIKALRTVTHSVASGVVLCTEHKW